MANAASDANTPVFHQQADDVVVSTGKQPLSSPLNGNPSLSSLLGGAVSVMSTLPDISPISDAAVIRTGISSGDAAVPSTSATPSYADAIHTSSINANDAVRNKPKVRHFQPNSSHLKAWMSRAVSFKAPRQNTSLNDYLQAICSVVPPDQITDSSRISGTVQVYFKSPTWATQLIATGLDFRGQHIDILPVIIAPKRVTVSNVPPYFFDSDLRTLMSDFGQVQGRIESLPASVVPAVFGSVKSFRRVVTIQFASEKDFESLPPSVDCFLGSKKLTFYLNNPLRCHLCKETGHQQHACPNLPAPQAPRDAQTPPEIVETERETIPDSISAETRNSIFFSTDAAVSSASSTIGGEKLSVSEDTEGFRVPKSRKVKKRSSQTSTSGSQGSPSAKILSEKYSYVPSTNTWKDGDGCFTPIIHHSDLVAFTTNALAGTAVDKRRLIEALVTDIDSASALARQVTVPAYTDPTIASIDNSQARHRTRMRYTYIAKEIRRLFSFSGTDAATSDSQSAS